MDISCGLSTADRRHIIRNLETQPPRAFGVSRPHLKSIHF